MTCVSQPCVHGRAAAGCAAPASRLPRHRRCVACRGVAPLKTSRSSGFKYTPPPFEPLVPPDLEVDLPQFRGAAVDLAIAGAGPAGLATAARVAAQGLTVVIVDPNPLVHWPNNYGVWVDEFEAMGLQDCFEHEWSRANVWLGETNEKFLGRPYARVDRLKLKTKLIDQCLAYGVQFYRGRVKGCMHEANGSRLQCLDGTEVQAKLIVDATGHARRLTEMDGKHNPGFQAAYGIMAEVESHPFDLDTMLFMDWRDSHLAAYPTLKAENERLPTFLYAMPFSPERVFLEETSLVARPGVPFEDLKERMYARLQHLGVKVTKVIEEEYCLIPMGGVLPRRDQRVIGVGGTAGLVHPSTGYMVARTLGAVPQLADRIVDELRTPSHLLQSGRPGVTDPMLVRAQRVWDSIWPAPRLRQREFMTFGMEMLLTLNLSQTRSFFTAFFSLSDFHWRGFLSSRLSFTELFVFGLTLFAKASNESRVNLMVNGLPLLPSMVASIVKAQQQMPDYKLGQEKLAMAPEGEAASAPAARL